MRRAQKIPLVSGTLYRNVAMLAVGLAVVVALGSGDRKDGQAIRLPAAKASERAAETSSQNPVSDGFDDTVQTAAPVQPSAAENSPAEIGSAGISAEQIGPAPAASGAPPPLPAGTILPGPRGQIANPAKPTPAQMRHLIEQSRIRSGASPGGD